MIIPDRVNVCGTVYDVIVTEKPTVIDNGIARGLCSNARQILYVFSKIGFTDVVLNTVAIIDQNVEMMVSTLYHEIFHAILSVLSLGEHNNEANADLFSNIAVNINKDDNLMEIFETFRKIVTEISDADYRKIEYVIANTKFEFDKLDE